MRPASPRLAVAVACLALGLACPGDAPPPELPGATLPVVWLEVGPHRISAEVAASASARTRGLMFRESLPPDHGMLFVFPDEAPRSFWMRNTPLPLSIAYADAGGRIVHIADLEPLDERSVPSRYPARYALEMRQGWFRDRAVRPGDRLGGIAELGAD